MPSGDRGAAPKARVLDGVRNLVAANTNGWLQDCMSNLIDAYKWNELVDQQVPGAPAVPCGVLEALGWGGAVPPQRTPMSQRDHSSYKKKIHGEQDLSFKSANSEMPRCSTKPTAQQTPSGGLIKCVCEYSLPVSSFPPLIRKYKHVCHKHRPFLLPKFLRRFEHLFF